MKYASNTLLKHHWTMLITLAWLLGSCVVPLYSGEYSKKSWPQWRGPTRDSMVSGDPWPESLQADHLKERWRVDLGPSYSGPIVVKNKVIVTETLEEKYEVVTALDRRSGKEIWKTGWKGAMEVIPIGTRTGSWMKATPTYDGESLFVASMRDVLVCLDAETGDERWRVDFADRYKTPLPELGFICSPLIDGDSVYVQAADSFIRLDKETGKTIWRVLIEKEKGHGSYSCPGLATIHGKRQLLVATISDIVGVDPESGDVLWSRRLDSIDQGCVLTPIAYSGGIFTSTRASQTGLYGLTLENGRFTMSQAWRSKLVAYMSAPIIIDDYAYMHLKNRRMACIDLKTGKERWINSKRMGMYCSMICRDDRILALSNEGELMLIRATPDKFDLLDSRTLADSETWGHLAISGNALFLRELNAIVALEWK